MKAFADGGYVSGDLTGIAGEVAGVLRPGEHWLITEPTQLDRIEAKLAALLDALADAGNDENT